MSTGEGKHNNETQVYKALNAESQMYQIRMPLCYIRFAQTNKIVEVEKQRMKSRKKKLSHRRSEMENCETTLGMDKSQANIRTLHLNVNFAFQGFSCIHLHHHFRATHPNQFTIFHFTIFLHLFIITFLFVAFPMSMFLLSSKHRQYKC